MSVAVLRSWASSTMTTLYADSSGSSASSRNSTPSVRNLISVTPYTRTRLTSVTLCAHGISARGLEAGAL